MAEEDLLFGKNRHLFGGIEPSLMQTFTAARNLDGVVEIHAVLPNDTIVSDQTLCTVQGAIIRRKKTDYPKDEFDGDLVADLRTSTTFIDENTNLDDAYYYAAFPYTTQGVYSRNEANRASVKTQYYFGYDLNLEDTNPATRVTYPNDVDNASYAPAKMIFGGSFSYGGWNIPAGKKFMPKPCMLKFDGTVDHYLDPDDYTKRTDGAASQVANINFDGNAMMEWPKIFVKRWEEDGVYHFRCSDRKLDDGYECWSNYDKNNAEIEHFYTPIYFGSKDSAGRLRSISGQTNWVTTGGAQPEVNAAKENGVDIWYIEVLSDRELIKDLLTMIGKSTAGQETFGYGRCGTSSAVQPGTMNTKGMFWGSNDKTSGVKIFGMEHWYGNIWRRLAGWICANGTQKAKLTRGTKDGTTAADYNFDGSGYLTVSSATPTGTGGGYIKQMKTEAYGRFPYDASGSSSTYECDGLWFNNGITAYAFVGGGWNDGLLVGPFCAHLYNAASVSTADRGAALSCKPLAV